MKSETEIKARPTVNYLDEGLAIVKAMTKIGFKAGTQSKKILNTMLCLFEEFCGDAGIDSETMVKDQSVPIHLNCDVTPYITGEDGKEKLHHFDMVFTCQNNEDKTDFWITMNGGKKIFDVKFTRSLMNGSAMDKDNPFDTVYERQFKYKPTDMESAIHEIHEFYKEIRKEIADKEEKQDNDILDSVL